MEKRNKIVPKWELDMFIQKHTSSIQKNEIIIDTSNLSIKQTQNRIEKLLK